MKTIYITQHNGVLCYKDYAFEWVKAPRIRVEPLSKFYENDLVKLPPTEELLFTIKVIDRMTWKVKVLNAVINATVTFLNWLTFPTRKKEDSEITINIKFEVTTA